MKYVYTAITGGRDRLRGISPRAAGWHYVCFTAGSGHPDWDVRPAVAESADPVRNARAHKLRPDLHLPDAEISLWLDGNFEVACDLDELVDRYLADADIAFHRHPQRDCVYEEALACIERGKDDAEVVARQVLGYAAQGVPAHAGLPATGVVLRRHTRRIARFNERWEGEVQRGSRRDQLSVMYALETEQIAVAYFDSELWNGPLFSWRRHDGT
jgi:hypothetical protein